MSMPERAIILDQDLMTVANAGGIRGDENLAMLKWFLQNWIKDIRSLAADKRERISCKQRLDLTIKAKNALAVLINEKTKLPKILLSAELRQVQRDRACPISYTRRVPGELQRFFDDLTKYHALADSELTSIDKELSGSVENRIGSAAKEDANYLALQILVYWRNQGRLSSDRDLNNPRLIGFSREVFALVEQYEIPRRNRKKLKRNGIHRRFAAQFEAAMRFPMLPPGSEARLKMRALWRRAHLPVSTASRLV